LVKCINYYFHHKQKKDSKKIKSSGLKPKVQELLTLIEKNPLCYPPKFEYLSANLKNKISRRINKQHRISL
jgi:Txe/YoeB family toxin of toxin-antitoxin system